MIMSGNGHDIHPVEVGRKAPSWHPDPKDPHALEAHRPRRQERLSQTTQIPGLELGNASTMISPMIG